MTLDDMQQQWQHQSGTIGIEFAVRTAVEVRRLESALDRVRRSITIELLLNLAAVVLLGSFIADHRGDWRDVVAAVALDLCAIALVAASVRHLAALRLIDYDAPVLDVQRRIAKLKMERIRTVTWTLVVAPALWTPLLLVAIRGLFGIDPFAVLDRTWIAVNVIASLAFIPAMVWVARTYGERLVRMPLIRRLADDLAGRSMRDAAAFADRLARFVVG